MIWAPTHLHQEPGKGRLQPYPTSALTPSQAEADPYRVRGWFDQAAPFAIPMRVIMDETWRGEAVGQGNLHFWMPA